MSLKSVLTTYGQIGVSIMQEAVRPLSATGKTVRSIRYEIQNVFNSEQLGLFFYARDFFALLERGIKPSQKRPSKEMIDSLTEYAKARGMQNPKKAAWAIAINQLKEGDTTHRKGGRELFSQDLQNMLKNLSEDLAKDYSIALAGNIKKQFEK